MISRKILLNWLVNTMIKATTFLLQIILFTEQVITSKKITFYIDRLIDDSP